MNQFEKYLLNQAYEKAARLGDRLAKLEEAIDWESFRPIIRAMYTNNTLLGGRPNTDEVLMVKLLVLQQCRDFMSSNGRRRTGSASRGSSGGPRGPPTTRRCGSSGNASPPP